MTRHVLDEGSIHPDIREKVAGHHREIVDEVRRAIEDHDVVVVGMAQNPHVRKARAALKEKGVAFYYLEYGSYLGEWRRRNAIKMWTGWPTFPMVFVKGTLVGGNVELRKLLAAGGLEEMLRA